MIGGECVCVGRRVYVRFVGTCVSIPSLPCNPDVVC